MNIFFLFNGYIARLPSEPTRCRLGCLRYLLSNGLLLEFGSEGSRA
jgi:hypothetical protein